MASYTAAARISTFHPSAPLTRPQNVSWLIAAFA